MAGELNTFQIGAGWFPDDPGGLERVYYALWKHLPRVGVGVRGVVTGSPSAVDESGGTVTAFSKADAPLWRRWMRVRTTGREQLAAGSFSLVAAHFALYALPLLDSIRPFPFVVHFHGPWAWEGEAEGTALTPVKAAFERAVYGRADRFIVLSQAFRNVLCEQYGVEEKRVDVVPGGVEADRFDIDANQNEARTRLGWPPDRPVVLAVRRLAKRMGLENMIDGMSYVRDDISDVLLLIAGQGPLRSELQRRIEERGLQDHIRLLGFVPDADLPFAYRAADLSVVPTVALEGFGLITLESLAAGTPVLVTPIGGLPEAVRGLSEALILEGTAPDVIADGVTGSLLGRRVLPTDEACVGYVRRQHDWPIIARQVQEVYERAITAHGA